MDTAVQLTVQKLLSAVERYQASELHLSVGNQPLVKVQNQLRPLTEEPVLDEQFMESLVNSIISIKQKKKLIAERQIVFAYDFGGRVRFKVIIYYQQNFLTATLQAIPRQIRLFTDLGLPSSVEQITALTKGLVIISGPFGSGKTTTLAAALEAINQRETKRIVTLEQPVEYLFNDQRSVIEQREVGTDVVSFEDGLKFLLQENAEIIMLSDFEGRPTMQAAFDVLASGRLILAGMKVETVRRTIEKIVQSFPPSEQAQAREQLAQFLAVVVCQKMLVNSQGEKVLAVELLWPTAAVKSIIKDGDLGQLDNFLQTGRSEGMISFDQSLAGLVQSGKLTAAQAVSTARDPENLKALLG